MPDDEFEPDDFRNQQEYLYGLIGFEYGFSADAPQALYSDGMVHDLFGAIMYNDELTAEQREMYHEQLSTYLYEEYGILFDDVWSWEDFREWYETA